MNAAIEPFLRDIIGHDWCSNVRELRSCLQQAVVMSDAKALDEPMSDSVTRGSAAPRHPASQTIAPLQAIAEGAEHVCICKT